MQVRFVDGPLAGRQLGAPARVGPPLALRVRVEAGGAATLRAASEQPSGPGWTTYMLLLGTRGGDPVFVLDEDARRGGDAPSGAGAADTGGTPV